MSKHETWRTRKYHKSIGGLLIEEFHAIPASRDKCVGRRVIDGVIVLGEEDIYDGHKYDLSDRDVIAIQTKSGRLGMYLMGQAYFTREILKRFNPKSIKTVAICGKGDTEMEALCESFGINVVIIPESENDSL